VGVISRSVPRSARCCPGCPVVVVDRRWSTARDFRWWSLGVGAPCLVALAEHFRSGGVRVKRLATSHAFHSSLMDPMLECFPVRWPRRWSNSGAVAAGGSPMSPVCWRVLISCVRPEYWVSHVRQAVRFADGVGVPCGPRGWSAGLWRVGPGGALTAVVGGGWWLRCVRRDRSEPAGVVAALGSVARYRGVAVDWSAFFAPAGAHQHRSCRTYAFRAPALLAGGDAVWPPLTWPRSASAPVESPLPRRRRPARGGRRFRS